MLTPICVGESCLASDGVMAVQLTIEERLRNTLPTAMHLIPPSFVQRAVRFVKIKQLCRGLTSLH